MRQVVIVAAVLGYTLSGSIARSIGKLASATTDVAAGNFDRRVELNSRDILALNNLAFLQLTRKNDPGRAWEYILAAEAINPSQPLVQANKSLIAAAR